jgi:DNA-binding protein HU-beta
MAKSQSKPQTKSPTKKPLTKTALLQAVADTLGDGASKKEVKTVLDAVVSIAHQELKKTGLFVLPGFAKFVVVKKPARPARKGINPFTKEPMVFAAKPASKSVKARPIKAIKDAIA